MENPIYYMYYPNILYGISNILYGIPNISIPKSQYINSFFSIYQFLNSIYFMVLPTTKYEVNILYRIVNILIIIPIYNMGLLLTGINVKTR